MTLFLGGSRSKSAFLIFFLTAIVYIPVYNAGFVWDDDAFLTTNSLIRSADGLFRIWFTTEAPDYFPLVSTSLWIEWRLWGLNASGYHIVNVALHAFSSYLIFLLFKEAGFKWALFAALLFALHPVNVESVAWITERKNTLTLPLYLASILFFVRFQRDGGQSRYLASLLLFTLSLLAKTSVVMLPIILFGIVLLKKGLVRLKDVRGILPFLGLAFIMGLVTVWFQYNRAIGAESIRDDGFFLRLATAGTAVWFYLYKIFLPFNLIFVYPRWDFSGESPVIYLPLVCLGGGLFLFWNRMHSWGRPLFYGTTYFLVTLLPVLGFLDIYFMKFSLIADHWQYFALAGPLGLLAYWWNVLFDRLKEQGKNILLMAGVLIVLLLGSLSFSQAKVYKNELALYNHIIRKNKTCWMAYNNRGHLYDVKGHTAKALRDFDRAILLNPDYAEAYFNRAVLMGRSGKVEAAMEGYTLAVKARPEYAEAYYNRGHLYLNKGRKRDAQKDFSRALFINPDFFGAYTNRGALLVADGDHVSALDDFNKAISLEPGNSRAYVNRGVAVAMSGDFRRAIVDFTKAIDLNDGEVLAFINRSYAYEELGRYALSLKDIERAVTMGHVPDKKQLNELNGLVKKRSDRH